MSDDVGSGFNVADSVKPDQDLSEGRPGVSDQSRILRFFTSSLLSTNG